MRNHVFVRTWKKEDIARFVEWSRGTRDNLFDPDTVKYPTTVVRCAYNHDGPMIYLPVQQPFFLEHLAIRPGLGPADTAVAMRELVHDAVSQAHIKGSGEIYFLCKEESTIQIAKHQLFEEMPWRLFRIKLKDLEGKADETNIPTSSSPLPTSNEQGDTGAIPARG